MGTSSHGMTRGGSLSEGASSAPARVASSSGAPDFFLETHA
jgi:hypothetical protein